MKASTATTGLVCVTTPSSDNGTEADVQVTFPTGFTVSGTASNWTVATTNLPSGATAWPGINTASSVSSQTVTFPSTNLSTSTLYCFRWTGGTTLTNSSAGSDKTGSITTRTSGPATIDSGNYATAVISDDQIAVTATVSTTFSFALSGNSESIGTLSTSSVTSASGVTATITTNASAGWIAWLKSANAALSSSASGGSIATPGSIDNAPSSLAGQSGYVVDVDITTDATGGGTVSQASDFGAEYAGANTNEGGDLSTTLQPIAANNGTANGDILTLIARAKASGNTPAASDYADTLTVVAAGRF